MDRYMDVDRVQYVEVDVVRFFLFLSFPFLSFPFLVLFGCFDVILRGDLRLALRFFFS